MWSVGGTYMNGWLTVRSTRAFFRCCDPQDFMLIVFFAHSLHAGSSDFWVHSQLSEEYSPAKSSTSKFVGGSGYQLAYADLSYIQVGTRTTLLFSPSTSVHKLET